MLHVKFQFLSNQDTLTYFPAKNRSKTFICINGLKNHVEASDLVHTHLLCLDPYWFSSWLGNFWPSGGQKHLKGGVTRAPSQWKVFRNFFVHVLRYQFETWHLHLVGGVTRQVWVSFQSGHLTYFTAKKRSKSFICINGLKKSYRGFRFSTHTFIVSVLIPTDFRHGWAIFGPLADKNTWKGGVTRAPSQWKVFRTFLYTFWDISLKLGIYI